MGSRKHHFNIKLLYFIHGIFYLLISLSYKSGFIKHVIRYVGHNVLPSGFCSDELNAWRWLRVIGNLIIAVTASYLVYGDWHIDDIHVVG